MFIRLGKCPIYMDKNPKTNIIGRPSLILEKETE